MIRGRMKMLKAGLSDMVNAPFTGDCVVPDTPLRHGPAGQAK